jgi:hypothetical protein
MDSYMGDYGQSFMVYQNLSHAHLQVVGLTQISTDMSEPKALDSWYNLWMRVKGPHDCMVIAPRLACEVVFLLHD